MAKVVLPVPGGPKRITALGGGDPVPPGYLRVCQRQHDPAFDGLLLAFHARHGLPEAAGQQSATELGEPARLVRPQGVEQLVIDQPVTTGVAGVLERRRTGSPFGQRRADPANPRRPQPPLQVREQRAADSAAAPPRTQSHQQHPGAVALRLGHRHPDQLVTDRGYHRGLSRPGRRHHFRNGEHRFGVLRCPALIPDLDRLVQVVIVEVTEAPRRHWHPPLVRPLASTHLNGVLGKAGSLAA